MFNFVAENCHPVRSTISSYHISTSWFSIIMIRREQTLLNANPLILLILLRHGYDTIAEFNVDSKAEFS